MSFLKSRRIALVIAAALVGACGDSTAPTIDQIDAEAASLAAEPVVAVMDQPALLSFTSLDGAAGLPASASAAAAGAITRLTAAAARGRWDREVPRLARSVAAADVIPPDVRGNMYVYSEAMSSYVVSDAPDGDTPGAGIRVVLYAIDPLSGTPSSPLTRIGHVDLIDESNAGQNRVNVILVRAQGNLTLMDYDITHSVSNAGESFSIAGSATNGATPIAFNLSGTATETSVTVTFHLEAPSVNFSVDVSATANAVTGSATIETALRYDGHTLSFRLSFEGDDLHGDIRYDGKRYATVTVTTETAPGSVSSTVTFVKANGQPMTIEEIERIQAVFERALSFDQFWAALLWPVGALAPAM